MRSSRRLAWFAVAGLSLLLAAMTLAPWVASGAGPQKAGEQYKNVQVLKDAPADQFIPAMQFISASLGVGCDHCHVPGAFDKDDKKAKQTARVMMQMMFSINQANFGGERKVTCYSCHHGGAEPVSVPIIEQAASTPATQPAGAATELPSADKLVEKYLAALGGNDALAKNSARIAKGKAVLFGGRQFPLEIVFKSPDKAVSVTHLPDGDMASGYNGHGGWQATPGRPLRDLSAAELDAARLDSDFYLSHHLKDLFSGLQTSGVDNLAGHPAYAVVGKREGSPGTKLYFDQESGLLVRLVRFEETPLGLNPVQTDFSDYRDVNGVKVPYQVSTSRPGRRLEIQIDQVEQNVAIDDSKFDKPAQPAPK